ncbi:hypothetical protein [Rummeliibacillus pycnus]|uniref:hypothetical protein n=1 Tax=Rummeliibacillus pycnus TaxID=101070 RepID=UPI0037C50317
MKFNSRKKQEQTHFMLAAVIHGVLIGAAGVLLFFFILQTVEKRSAQPDEQTLSSSTSQSTKETSKPVKFYAIQYGVYTSSQAASDFLAGHPEYENVAIVPVGKQFYLWSAVGNNEKKIKSTVSKDAFVKPFTLSGAACEEKGLKNIPQLLEVGKVAKLNFSDSTKGKATPADWKGKVTAMTKVSNNLEVVKLQLLAHYVSQNDCLEIKF